ncbi:hypothetical protein U370_03525 [Anaplasma marginale str. Dawn]|nr:hypothetical protein U370_03525 [Anaplasma marginale str. Dawn]AXW84247.1 hypothetical protein CQZ76_03615 [Anaplasma marginale]AXW85171.1 hypothetical protein BKM88_03605 [Anaplasma marginale]
MGTVAALSVFAILYGGKLAVQRLQRAEHNGTCLCSYNLIICYTLSTNRLKLLGSQFMPQTHGFCSGFLVRVVIHISLRRSNRKCSLFIQRL